jgi:SulP family sulfate permease
MPPPEKRIAFKKGASSARFLAGWLEGVGLMAPLALGLMLFNGLNPPAIFFVTGLFGILTGLVFQITVPVAPMSIMAAYAIAGAVPTDRVLAAGLLSALVLVAMAATGTCDKVRSWVAPSVIRGAEAAAGLLLIPTAMDLITGATVVQTLCHAPEPHLKVQSLGAVPLGIFIGAAAVLGALLLLKTRRWPAGPIVIAAGLVLGLVLGTHDGLEKLQPGFYWLRWLPYGIPAGADFGLALVMLTLPQIPGTLDEVARLSRFGGSGARRMTATTLCVAAGLANLVSFTVGGPPLGFSGTFSAGRRWAGVISGAVLVALALLLGFHLVSLIHLIPLAVVGALLLLAGARMALGLAHLDNGRELLAALAVCGVTWGSNLALGVGAGVVVARLLRVEPTMAKPVR